MYTHRRKKKLNRNQTKKIKTIELLIILLIKQHNKNRKFPLHLALNAANNLHYTVDHISWSYKYSFFFVLLNKNSVCVSCSSEVIKKIETNETIVFKEFSITLKRYIFFC